MIGASEFASAVQQDQPTIDVMNAIGLDASAVGNHEFDRGWDDLRDRVIDNGANATWDYLGANVYEKGTETPALPEYMTYRHQRRRPSASSALSRRRRPRWSARPASRPSTSVTPSTRSTASPAS